MVSSDHASKCSPSIGLLNFLCCGSTAEQIPMIVIKLKLSLWLIKGHATIASGEHEVQDL
jgi:hypothetical protein